MSAHRGAVVWEALWARVAGRRGGGLCVLSAVYGWCALWF